MKHLSKIIPLCTRTSFMRMMKKKRFEIILGIRRKKFYAVRGREPKFKCFISFKQLKIQIGFNNTKRDLQSPW